MGFYRRLFMVCVLVLILPVSLFAEDTSCNGFDGDERNCVLSKACYCLYRKANVCDCEPIGVIPPEWEKIASGEHSVWGSFCTPPAYIAESYFGMGAELNFRPDSLPEPDLAMDSIQHEIHPELSGSAVQGGPVPGM